MKENLNLYRILIIAFLCICILLTYMNFMVIQNIYAIKERGSHADSISEAPVKKYGYSDVLSLVRQDVNLEILNIKSEIENTDNIDIDLEYNSTLDNFNNTLEKIKSESFFRSIENITIDKSNNNTPKIGFTAVFLKNK